MGKHALISYTHTRVAHCSPSSTDALKNMKSMLSAERVPLHLAITRLIQAMGSQGDVAGIQEVESLIKDLNMDGNLSSMVFVNNMALAHIKK